MLQVAFATLLFQTHSLEGFNVGLSASIQNRQFEVVDLDDDIVDAIADQ